VCREAFHLSYTSTTIRHEAAPKYQPDSGSHIFAFACRSTKEIIMAVKPIFSVRTKAMTPVQGLSSTKKKYAGVEDKTAKIKIERQSK
jgi:2-keto-3-deoxy-galactonokinase